VSGARGLERELIALVGPVECRSGSGAITLALAGRERGGAASEVLFAGAVATLPARLQDVRVLECGDAGGGRRYRIEAAGVPHWTLTARAVQVHRAAADRFYRRLPPAHVPWTLRLGWGALLIALRLPAVATWISKRSGS
jgi:hypothetical protein